MRMVVLFLLVGLALADPVTDAADQVLAATDLKQLASRDKPDPWLVVDELCRRGEFDKAEAFAKTAPRTDTEKLPAYVAAQRERPTDPGARKAIVVANRAFGARDPKAALAALESVKPTAGCVTSVRLLHGRGLALRALRRSRAATETFAKAGALARDLGWWARARVVFEAAGFVANDSSDWDSALRYWSAGLAIEQRRGDRIGIALALGNIGGIHHARGQYSKALETQQRALEINREIGYRPGIAANLVNIGTAYDCLGQQAKALEILQRAVKMMRELGNRGGAATALGNIGVIYSDRGQYSKALETQRQALEAKQKVGDHAGAAATVCCIGTIRQSLGDHAGALETYQRALEMYQQAGNRAGVALTLSNIGVIHTVLGRYSTALGFHRRALKMQREIGDRARVSTTLNRIGTIQRRVGQYAEALEAQQRALEIMREVGDRTGVAEVLNEIGTIHYSLGQYAKALEIWHRVLKLVQASGNRGSVAKTLVNIATIHACLGRHAKALGIEQRALEIMRETTGDRWNFATALGNVGLTLHSLGRYAEALDAQQRALKIMQEIGDRAGIARNLGNIGNIHLALRQLDAGRKHYEPALALARELGVSEVQRWATNLGCTLTLLDRPADAVPLFEEAIAASEAQRDAARGLSEGTRAGFFRAIQISNPYRGLAFAHLKLGHPSAALEALERGRARGVLDLLARSSFDPLAEAERRAKEQDDEERLAAVAKARADLAGAERDIRAYTYSLSKKQVPANRSALNAKLKQARALRSEVLDRRSRLVRDLVPVAKPASLASIQGALKPKERMLFYCVDERGSFLFVVPPAGKKVRAWVLFWPDRTPVLSRDLENAVRSHVAAMRTAGRAARGMKPVEGAAQGDPDAGARLAAALLPQEARDELEGLDRVYLVPHRILHRLPFEALPGVQLPPTVYGHSASVFLWCRRRRTAQRAGAQRYQVVALGDPVFSRGKTEAQPPESGVLVVSGAPGLLTGDVLLTYDGHALADANSLRAEVRRVEDEAEEQGRRTIKLRIWRAGREVEVTVQPGPLGIQVAREPPRKAWPKLREQSLLTLQRSASVDSFGDLPRLPGTRREVESIRKALGDKVAVLLGEDATKANLFALAPQGRFLHLATHQLVDETERRGYSRLALTRPHIATPGDDGFLSLFELLGSWRDRLSACELVVLSACETLKGPMQKDEGPYAMPLGFLYAGAPAVIGSLWRVDDASTAELFADFYKRLAAGKPKLEAFTEARNALRKKYPQPYFWAPFIYIGDPR